MANACVFDTGDIVKHGPTGETWQVACCHDDQLYWLGWPEGYGDPADCTLVEKASEEERESLTAKLAEANHPNRHHDHRRRCAAYRLWKRQKDEDDSRTLAWLERVIS